MDTGNNPDQQSQLDAAKADLLAATQHPRREQPYSREEMLRQILAAHAAVSDQANSRDKSIALTKLDEALMWAQRI